jgi:hypothetical protein
MAGNWDGSEWTTQEIPISPELDEAYLLGLSCPGVNFCKAVGWSFDEEAEEAKTPVESLAMGWNGLEWAAEFTPTPPESGFSRFHDVSCSSTVLCQAVGVYNKGAEESFTLGARWK